MKYLIVGQGLAGTLLSHFLLKKGAQIKVIDQFSENAASQVAAGVINPITGRRFVKSWRVDELIPFAQATYRELEKQLGISFYSPRHILRTLFNHREESDWLLRTDELPYQQYMAEEADLEAYAKHTELAYAYGETLKGAQVNVGTLVIAFRQMLKEQGGVQEEEFDYSQVTFLENGVQYKEETFDQIIFCEGYRATNNPFFNYLPFGGAKGEVLIVRIPNVQFEKLLKHRVFIVPLKDDLYWIGATYNWKFEDDQPTEEGGQFLEERLKDFLKVPFEIIEHKAAIRPTVKDRRPFLGQHPQYAGLAIFNGLGTKGASLGPFWAAQMAEFITLNIPLDKAVDIERF